MCMSQLRHITWYTLCAYIYLYAQAVYIVYCCLSVEWMAREDLRIRRVSVSNKGVGLMR